MIKPQTITKLFYLFLLAISFAFIFSLQPASTNALSGSEFKAGNIIDDLIFFDKSSLSSAQIQSFLNAKVPNCDTNGTQPYAGTTRAAYGASRGNPAPFTCIKDYRQNEPRIVNSGSDLCGGVVPGGNNVLASQMIYDVSQACGINPKVLIILLEKEQSLITDSWPWNIQYRSATGYGCPDTAPCDSEYYGFFNQIYQAARAYKRYQANSKNYNYQAGRNNNILYNPSLSCGSSPVYIQNQATAGLYIYTPYQPNQAALNNLYGTGDSCSAYGNRNFWRLFNDWFGKSMTPPPTECDSKVKDIVCVWSVIKSDGSQFLTSNKSEFDTTINSYGWVNEGYAFYASSVNKPGYLPVHRMRMDSKHYYSVDNQEYNILKNDPRWVDEGIKFYVLPSASNNTSHKIYKLNKSSSNQHYWAINDTQKNNLINQGFVIENNSFNSFSGMANITQSDDSTRYNIYASTCKLERFMTTNLAELDSVIKSGCSYNGITTTSPVATTSTPVYRLYGNGEHFYTTSPTERDSATSKYGYTYEGIKFYLDDTSSQIYRLINPNTHMHTYISDFGSAYTLVKSGWQYETVLDNQRLNNIPVLRFINNKNSEHFYTTSVKEAMSLYASPWTYEKVAFYASMNPVSTPVYRLYGNGEHFYTTSSTERDSAVSKYGYTYEGIKFYVSNTPSSTPVYRLYGNGEHFYTTNLTESDNAVSKYGYIYEGIGFYLF